MGDKQATQQTNSATNTQQVNSQHNLANNLFTIFPTFSYEEQQSRLKFALENSNHTAGQYLIKVAFSEIT